MLLLALINEQLFETLGCDIYKVHCRGGLMFSYFIPEIDFFGVGQVKPNTGQYFFLFRSNNPLKTIIYNGCSSICDRFLIPLLPTKLQFAKYISLSIGK